MARCHILNRFSHADRIGSLRCGARMTVLAAWSKIVSQGLV